MTQSTRAVLFDMDGLMLDTERIALECWLETAEAVGWRLTTDDCLAMVGLDQQGSEQALRARVGSGFPMQQVSDIAKQRYVARLRTEGIGLKPGLLPLLDSLSRREIPIAVATSSHHRLAHEKLELAGIRARFEVIVCGDQVPQGKPAPWVYLQAAERLGVETRHAIALEDSDIGLRAAHAAGIRCIVVPDLRQPASEHAGLAHAVLPSLVEAAHEVDRLLAQRT